ncbi:helix-turn-helix domain-containing protein [Actinopolyspora mortivallis]|uniref:DNA-binding protein n=1 Tax=Actinopolyspora mortivallis TaxID=33906 RepID=A0A2T0GTD6_ACTMO|nr:helix-turn-helix transcriptional regulator [Actinopolyspora mortivallis]PRW62357.1 DNA-binding protein [Actinopolyspora mortivallis]
MAGSSAPLRRLGAELRRLREAAGRTQSDVGSAIGRTHTTLVNWELGKTKISKSDLVCLLAELRTPTEVRKGLEQLRDQAGRETSQWATYGLPDWLRPLVSFEEDAVTVTSFEPVLIPGLLQTENYARSVHTAGRRKVASEFVDRWVAARMQRQQRLSGPDPLRLSAVISEAAIRLRVGGAEVCVDQLRRLLELGQQDNISIRILTADENGYGGVASNFTVLHFADPKVDPPLGYFDGPLGGHMISDEGDVATMVNMFDDLRHMALSETDSAEMIAAVLEQRERESGTHV